MYALEKVRCEFHANKEITDSEKIAVLVAKAQENLDIVKRQVFLLLSFCALKLIFMTGTIFFLTLPPSAFYLIYIMRLFKSSLDLNL